MKANNPPKHQWTWVAGILVTVYHFLLIFLVADRMAIVWFELPALAITVGLAYCHRINLNLALCYTTVCLFLLIDPAVRFFFVTWLALIPYLILLEREKRFWVLAGLGAWTGMLVASGVYSWMWRSMTVFFELSMAVALCLFLLFIFLIGIQHAIFLPLARFLRNRFEWPIVLIAPGLYTVIEYWMPLPMPIALSAGLVYMPFFLQPLDLLGMHGVSLLIAVVSAALYFAFKTLRAGNKRYFLISMGIAIIILALQTGYGVWCFSHYRDDGASSSSVDIAMIQPVAPLKVRNTDVQLQERIAAELKRLSFKAIEDGDKRPDLLIWPEGAGPFASRTPEFNPAYMRAVVDLQQATSTTLLVQDVEFTKMSMTGKVRYYSTMSLIKPVGQVESSYRKNILMPFSEYLPMENRFPFLRRWLPQARSVLPGEAAVPLHGPGGKIAPLICYEVLFPNYVRRLVGQGCLYIVNLTNDRWYGTRQQPMQHLGMTVLRAIENRKPVARATNSGISAFIDARGVIPPDERTPIMEKAILRGRLYPRKGTTFYNRYGDLIHPWVLTPFYLVLCIYGLIAKRSDRTCAKQASPPRVSRRGRKRG
jgi:apolipoprotein N-acyltransferase